MPMYNNPQVGALQDYYGSTRGTQPTPPMNTTRVMPGAGQPVQPVQPQSPGVMGDPMSYGAPVNALVNHYGATPQAPGVMGQPQTMPAGATPVAPGSLGPAQPMRANPVVQPGQSPGGYVTTPNTPPVSYAQPMSPQVQALRSHMTTQ